MMTRADLEARVWAITGRDLTGTMIDDILDACEEYAADRQPREPRPAVRHTTHTDLWPVIGLLADALMNDGEPELAEVVTLPVAGAA